MTKKRIVAQVLFDDGTRIALFASGAFAYLTDDREAQLAYAAVAGESPLPIREAFPLSRTRTTIFRPGSNCIDILQTFKSLYWSALTTAGDIDVFSASKPFVHPALSPFTDFITAARKRHTARAVAHEETEYFAKQRVYLHRKAWQHVGG